MTALPLWAAELGDDGLHKPEWLRDTFTDMREDLGGDLGDANAEGKRLLVIVEQRGCIWCTQIHEKVFPDTRIDAFVRDSCFVVQMNLFGDVEVTDFDGTVLSEKDMAVRWGAMFTPTMIFLPEALADGATVAGGGCGDGARCLLKQARPSRCTSGFAIMDSIAANTSRSISQTGRVCETDCKPLKNISKVKYPMIHIIDFLMTV